LTTRRNISARAPVSFNEAFPHEVFNAFVACHGAIGGFARRLLQLPHAADPRRRRAAGLDRRVPEWQPGRRHRRQLSLLSRSAPAAMGG
jgi:hypothetical protein